MIIKHEENNPVVWNPKHRLNSPHVPDIHYKNQCARIVWAPHTMFAGENIFFHGMLKIK